MTTDLPSSFNTDVTNVGGFEMAQRAASDCYKKSGYSARDVDVVELHDCFAPTVVILCIALLLLFLDNVQYYMFSYNCLTT